MVEQRTRSWSATRLKLQAKVWTRFLCIRLIKVIFLTGLVLSTILYLEFRIYQLRGNLSQDWNPAILMQMSANLPKVQLVSNTRQSNQASDITSPHVCLHEFQGGLGNRMFQYAAAYVAASRSNKTLKLTVKDALQLPFVETSYSAFYFFVCRGQTLTERLPCAYDERLMQTTKPSDDNIRLKGYWQSWKYFRHQEIDLRREFKFHPDIVKIVNNFLNPYSNFTLIGVHIRRGDMMNEISKQYGYQIPPPHYFHKALRWFRRRFPDALFIVCSNDIKYSKSVLGNEKDVFFSEDHSPAQDLAILSKCSHMIMSVGTFGWWGGWLSGGQTIYYKNYAKKGSLFSKHLVAEDFFPPTWIGME